MNVYEEYQKIFRKEIIDESKGIIFSYSTCRKEYFFQPFSHGVEGDAVNKLGALMRKNLFFYCYGEDEAIEEYEIDSDMENNSKYAYKNRLPKRKPDVDGLLGEVLLDLLIQIYNPEAHKLAVRQILRQNDNFEIKGYDAIYFTTFDDKISIWLGQAKLGNKDYCKKSLNEDLLSKYNRNYFAEQFLFICDKKTIKTDEVEKITKVINNINRKTIRSSDERRAEELVEYFRKNSIDLMIPCLAAYGENTVYNDVNALMEKIDLELRDIQEFFGNKNYESENFELKIIFFIFPIADLGKLRDKNGGFYGGLF